MKPTLIVDVDGPLLNYNKGYAKHWERLTGEPVELKDPTAYHAHNQYKVPFLEGEALDIFERTFDEQFWLSLDPMPGAIRAIEKLAKKYEIFAVTTSSTDYFNVRRSHIYRLGFNIIDVVSVGNKNPGFTPWSYNPKAMYINLMKPDIVIDDLYVGLLGLDDKPIKYLIDRNASDPKGPARGLDGSLKSGITEIPNIRILSSTGEYKESGLKSVLEDMSKTDSSFSLTTF